MLAAVSFYAKQSRTDVVHKRIKTHVASESSVKKPLHLRNSLMQACVNMRAADEFPLPEWASDFFPAVELLHQERERAKFNPFIHLLAPKSTEAKDIRQWIKSVCAEAWITPTEIANKADLAPSTINKFMTDVDGIRNLNARTLNKIKAAVEVYLSYRAAADEQYVEHEFGVTPSGDLPLIHSNPYYLRKIKVICDLYDQGVRVNLELQLPPERMYEIILPVTKRFIDATLCGLQLNVGDVEEYYNYQDIFVVTPIWTFEGEIAGGDRLVVLEQDTYPGQSRMSVRDVLVDPKGHNWLISPYGRDGENKPIYAGKSSHKKLPDTFAALFLVAGSYHHR